MINLNEKIYKNKYKIFILFMLILMLTFFNTISLAATDINTCTITITGTYNYDSTPKKATCSIIDPSNGNYLTESIDYSVKYEDNVNAGNEAKVIVIGKGNYSGTATKTFTINKRDLNVIPNSNQSKIVGTPDKELKFAFNNQVDIEYPEFTGSLSREAGEVVGEYNITQGTLLMSDHGLFKASNYNLILTNNVEFSILEGDSLTLEFTMPANGILKLPIPSRGLNDYVIAWGDGAASYITTEGFPAHQYTSAGKYTVRISGKAAVFGNINSAEVDQTGTYKDYYSFCNYLTKIVSFGNIQAERIGFANCRNLEGNIPAPSGFDYLTSAENMFYRCEKLSGSIPAGFFKDLNGINSAKNTFYGCTLLAGNLEPTLFQGCTRIRSFEGTFYGMINITGEIPADLFKDSTRVESFDSTFYGMTKLSGTIPSELFKYNKLVQSFAQTFGNCVMLANVPEDIFVENDLATNYYRTFYNCKGFTEIPAAVLTNNRVHDISNDVAIKDDYNGTFEGCSGVTYLETDLYMIGCNMFADCNSIEEILLMHPARIGTNAFKNCDALKTIMIGKEKLYEIGNNAFLYGGTTPDKRITYINSNNEILKNYDWEGSNRELDITPPKGTVEIVIPEPPYTNTRNVTLHIDVEDEVSDKSNIKIAIINDVMYTKETTGTLSNYRAAIAEYEERIANPDTTSEEIESLQATIDSLKEKISAIEIGMMPKDMLNWEPFVENKEWQLTVEDGVKIVYVYFMDEMGNISNFIQEF